MIAGLKLVESTLLAGFGSDVVVVTVAEFCTMAVAPDASATVTVTVVVAPGASVPITQFTVCAVCVHAPCCAIAPTKVVSGSSGSVTRTSRAWDGPALCTVSAYVRFAPATGASGENVFTIETSARLLSVPEAVAELLAGFGSVWSPETDAVLRRAVPGSIDGDTMPVTVMLALAPTASAPTEHEIVAPVVQVPCAEVAAVTENPAGTASVTATP